MKAAPVRLRSFDITAALAGTFAAGSPVPKPAPQRPSASPPVAAPDSKPKVTPTWLARFRAATTPTTLPSRGHGAATNLPKEYLPTPAPQIPALSRADVQAAAGTVAAGENADAIKQLLSGRDGRLPNRPNCEKPMAAAERAWPARQTPRQPAAVKPSAAPQVNFNVQRFGIEVSFSSKPETDVLEALKAARFRWSRFSKCWYKPASQESLQQATTITGQSNDAHLALSRAMEGELGHRGDMAMEAACGIA